MKVRAKKHLGQHFIKDKSICIKIADAVQNVDAKRILEVGPGTGALTEFLLLKKDYELHVIELDRESVEYLHENFLDLKGKIYERDFLKIDLIGNSQLRLQYWEGFFPLNYMFLQVSFRFISLIFVPK